MRLRSATVLVAALVLVSGCSGSSKPQTLPSLTPTPSATTAAVVVPSAATANTSLGLDAFVRYYFAQLNQAFRQGNAAVIRQLSTAACATCANYANSVGADGRHIVGDTFTEIEVAAPPIQQGGTIVEVNGVIPARQLADARGHIVKNLPAGGAFHFEVNVVRTNAGWTVRGIRKAA